jgi:predicted aldo/keto reductase-like oxidoreductase
MLYRKLGKSGLDVSNLGFGCMRLPIQGGSQSHLDGFDPNKIIDEEKATQMVEYAIEKGVNYFDTAYIYHAGQSETFLGKALKKYRSQIILVTKLPVMLLKKREDSDQFLEKQLKRLDTDHLDVYLLHGLGRRSWGMVKELGVLEFLDRIQKDGRAR